MKRPSVAKASKLLIAGMLQTAENDDRDGFALALREWDLDESATNEALQAWDEKRREVVRRRAGPRGPSR